MRIGLAVIAGIALLNFSGTARADDTPAKSRIVSIGLFKNGLAVIKRELTVDGPGTYVLEEVPEPVHGTYWVESKDAVESLVKMREVEVPARQSATVNFQEELAGKKVTIHFRGEKVPPLTGTIVELPRSGRDDEARARERAVRYYGEVPAQPPRMLIVQTAKGRAYVDSSDIVYVEAEGASDKVKQRRPVLHLTVSGTEKKQSTIGITYLARGISWAPSYRVDISDPKTLTIEQSAVIKNELANLDGAEVKLISGFPSVQFANVTSPLAPHMTWSTFFDQLNRRLDWESDGLRNTLAQQRSNAHMPMSLNLSAMPSGEGVDIHYQSIGKRTLAEGEALSLSLASGKASYERIVEWLVPDTRDEDGRAHNSRRHSGDNPDDEHDAAWDALKFKNPFKFPMTTASALVMANGQFNGQRLSYWVNSGEETMLRVTKALSVRTRALEYEDQMPSGKERELVWVGGRQYRKVTVQGELTANNHRQEVVSMVIRRRFSGDLLKADGSPKTVLREEGAYSVNRRNELVWTFLLASNEEKKLTYRYTVLVAH